MSFDALQKNFSRNIAIFLSGIIDQTHISFKLSPKKYFIDFIGFYFRKPWIYSFLLDFKFEQNESTGQESFAISNAELSRYWSQLNLWLATNKDIFIQSMMFNLQYFTRIGQKLNLSSVSSVCRVCMRIKISSQTSLIRNEAATKDPNQITLMNRKWLFLHTATMARIFAKAPKLNN